MRLWPFRSASGSDEPSSIEGGSVAPGDDAPADTAAPAGSEAPVAQLLPEAPPAAPPPASAGRPAGLQGGAGRRGLRCQQARPYPRARHRQERPSRPRSRTARLTPKRSGMAKGASSYLPAALALTG